MSYTYDADILCDACGKDVCERITKEGHAPSDPSDQSSYDSGEYPKDNHGLDDTADTPQHCGSGEDCLCAEVLKDGSKVGMFLMNDLTSEGEEYVKEQHRDSPSEITQMWMDHYGLELTEKGENSDYPSSDWRMEVQNGDTKLGYKEWVEHCMERDDAE